MDLERAHQTPVRILVLEEDVEGGAVMMGALTENVSGAEVVVAPSIHHYADQLNRSDFDIVIVDYDIPVVQAPEFLLRLQLRDHEPEVLVISRCDQLAIVRMIAKARLRYIVRDESWLMELVHSVREMLRLRQLKTENSSIRARLIEANGMLDDKNKRLDEFCATIAHDIRGPLAGLILKIDYILDSYEGKFDDRCTGLLTRSLESAHRLVGVVQAMYEFAKVGSKASKMELIDLKQLVNEVVGDLNVVEMRDIKIGVDNLPAVWCNAGLMRRVFINLINNAIKYCDKSEIKLNIGYDGDVEKSIARFARIYVEDNGPGIPEDEAKGIFKMFSRGKTGATKNSEGLGIGLAVVQKIVELHFGKVELETRVGEGCRFTFSLPMEKVNILS